MYRITVQSSVISSGSSSQTVNNVQIETNSDNDDTGSSYKELKLRYKVRILQQQVRRKDKKKSWNLPASSIILKKLECLLPQNLAFRWFQRNVFCALKKLIDDDRDCNLVFDSMAIRKQIMWDKQCKKYIGYCNYGNNLHLEGSDTVLQLRL